MSDSRLGEVRSFLADAQSAMETLLCELVALESPSDVPTSQAPVLERLADEFPPLAGMVGDPSRH